MPDRNDAALSYLSNRRSLPAKTFADPVPSREELTRILEIALRTPDHGKLEPWRLIVLEKPAMRRLADLAETRAKETNGDDEKIAKGRGQYDLGKLAVVVISSPKPVEKIPTDEQFLSAGALCMNIVHAATASGWGACWLTGWPAHDTAFCAQAFGCSGDEKVAGIIHIATPTAVPPDRPRPTLDKIVSWA